jgi:hypothetical protein
MEETIKYKTIDSKSIVDIQVSGTYYENLVQLLLALSQSVPKEEYVEALKKYKEETDPATLFELNTHLLITLVFEIERMATAQNKIKEVEINATTGKPVTEN